jgi:hypothetical protein
MNNTFSISFSDNAVQLIHVTTDNDGTKLCSCDNYQFPQQDPLDKVFCPENLVFFSKIIAEKRTGTNPEDLSILFCIPFNFACVKTVAFPVGSDKIQKKNQIEWEFNTVLQGNINEYKISVVNESVENEGFSKATAVALSRSLLKNLQNIAEENEIAIAGIFLNCFSIENYLDKSDNESDKNHIFLKIGNHHIEHHFYNKKRYLTSFIDAIILNNNQTREQYIVELAQDRIKQVSNLVTPGIEDSQFNMVVYGASLKDEITNVLKDNLSIPVENAQIPEFMDNVQDSYKYIEAWGSIL